MAQSPRKPAGPLDRLRAIALDLPEAIERETWDAPTFRVREKIFAMYRPGDHRTGGPDNRPSMWCKAPRGAQSLLVDADPLRFFAPPYVGPRGWIGMWLDKRVDWMEVAALIQRSWRMTAPKRLSMPGEEPSPPPGRRSLPSVR